MMENFDGRLCVCKTTWGEIQSIFWFKLPLALHACCMGMFHKIVIELFLEKNSDELVTFELKLWILMKNFCSISRKLMHTGIHLNSLKTTYQESMSTRKKTKTAQSRVKSTKRQRQKRETAWYSHLDFHAF